MTTRRFDPTEDVRPLQTRELDEAAATASEHGDLPLAFDVYRVADDLCIDFDVPGVEPATIRVALENQMLVVSAQRELEGSGVEVIERGRPHGSFEQRLVLPGHWDLEHLRAICANGVLSVRAPRKGPVAARTIAVEVARDQALIRTGDGDALGSDAVGLDTGAARVGTAA